MALASEAAAVGVFARTKDEIAATASLISQAGGRALALPVDVRNTGAVRAAVAETANTLGPVTLLVNNAGTPGPAGLDWEVDAEAWFECIEVGIRGAFLLSQAVIPGMISRRSGRIINTASITGTRAFLPTVATSVAKTALIRFTKCLAAELDGHGVHVFAIHPGVVRTRLLESYGLQLPEEWFVEPERAGSLCVRLACGRYDGLSGRYLTVDDDLDQLLSRTDDIAKRELLMLRLNVSEG